MNRAPIRAALALACAAPLLGACTLTSSQQGALSDLAGAVTSGTITAAEITPDLLTAAGASAADQAKAKSILAQIIATAQLTCQIAPTADSILRIVAALNPAAATVAIPVGTVVTAACDGLRSGTVSRPVAASRMRTAAPSPAIVRGQVRVNGVVVPLTGFADPSFGR